VIGLKENSSARTGVVHVHTVGLNQQDEPVLEFVRWVMVNKRDPASPAPESVMPELDPFVADKELMIPDGLDLGGFDTALSGSDLMWDDYDVGDRIDHVDGVTVEEAEHMMATRLYQNTARVHFNQFAEKDGRFARRIVYGGHVISLARALSFNGLANAFRIVAINAGSHVAPTFAGDTVFAWSEILGASNIPGRDDVGALRLRTVAVKDRACADFPYKDGAGKYDPAVVLDFDYAVLMPKRPSSTKRRQ